MNHISCFINHHCKGDANTTNQDKMTDNSDKLTGYFLVANGIILTNFQKRRRQKPIVSEKNGNFASK
jgi:hypothetical protein